MLTKIIKEKNMTTKVIVDNHGKFTIAIDHIQGGKIVSTDTIGPDQPHYDTIIHSGKHVIIREIHDGVESYMTFGQAIEALKSGKKVDRAGWNGKGMFLFLVPGSNFKVNRAPLLGIYPEGTEINYCPHIDMKTADDKVVPWLASQTDVLAEDWVIVE